MKCVKAVKNGKYSKVGDVIRVDNYDAQSKVDTKHWAFVPKSEWKAFTRKPKEEENKNESNEKQRKVQKD